MYKCDYVKLAGDRTASGQRAAQDQGGWAERLV